MTSKAQVDAIRAVIAAATARPCYTHEDARKASQSGDYSIVYVSRRFGGNVRGGTRENDLRLLQVRAVSKSDANVLLLEDKVADAFEHSTHDIAGTPVHFSFETQDATPERDDDGFYSRLTDYTFTL